MEEYAKTLKLAAFLLEYPDNNWWKEFPEYRAAVNELQSDQSKTIFEEIFAHAEQMGHKEFEDQYVRVFDFSQNTNLYLTTHDRTDFGKQSNEMHVYKNLFLSNGFDTDKELPDYLPALLELCAAVEPKAALNILSTIKSKLELLRDRFIEAKLIYAFLMDIVLTQLAVLEVSA
ncbi:MAG: nitrate reductase molybdenum cofactor assembly chaperone [Selenomonadaceae bacterium]|nr:nitrate reductase molybdenum cofactor assembly chaperone [Selenomonadaceae bacterium]MBR1579877.1 nitrate reductase molybdenum cofactor assembly chaperone [Selenomonadaceae bacterium]